MRVGVRCLVPKPKMYFLHRFITTNDTGEHHQNIDAGRHPLWGWAMFSRLGVVAKHQPNGRAPSLRFHGSYKNVKVEEQKMEKEKNIAGGDGRGIQESNKRVLYLPVFGYCPNKINTLDGWEGSWECVQRSIFRCGVAEAKI